MVWRSAINRWIAFIAGMPVLAHEAYAQDTTLLRPGVAVRFHLFPQSSEESADQRFQGSLVRLNADTVTVLLHPALGPTAIPKLWIATFEVSEGRMSALQGAWSRGRLGLLIGLGAGAVVGSAIANAENRRGGEFFKTVGTQMGVYALSLGVTFAFSGAIAPGERWRPVFFPVPPRGPPHN